MAIIVKDQNGNISPLAPSAVALGIEVPAVGAELDVAGFAVFRGHEGGGALGLIGSSDAEGGGGLGALWTNDAFNPPEPTVGWRRTINLLKGNVGIGGTNSVAHRPTERLVVDGNIVATGDVSLAGSDCAEDFDVDEVEALEPGTVTIIGENETLRQCSDAYDQRVAGVLSGAGDCRPGLQLGKQGFSQHKRMPLALTGKVFCKVDAHYAPIAVGDLLTTSPTPGHAMKVNDPSRAFGAVLGKALRSLPHGCGLIPILVTLQ